MNNIPVNSNINTQESSPNWKIEVSGNGTYSISHSKAKPVSDEISNLTKLQAIILANCEPTAESEVKDLKDLRACAKDIYKSYMDNLGISGWLKHKIVAWLNPTSTAHRIDQTYQSILNSTSAFADKPIPLTSKISTIYNKLPSIYEPDTVHDQENFIIEEPDFKRSNKTPPKEEQVDKGTSKPSS